MERRVLVTGASSGLGLSTACRLADAGFAVIALVVDASDADALQHEAAIRGSALRVVEADLSDERQRREATDGLDLYGLVNNAGYLNAGLLLDVPLDEARVQLETMVLAPMDLARRALPSMLTRGEGRIVNVTSAAVHTSTPFSGWYQACKAALRELTDALRLELDDTGIDVVDIEPGGFNTGIWDRAAEELQARRVHSGRPEAYDRPLEAIGRSESKLADPDGVAEVVLSALTSERPRPHYRVGRDAAPLRILSELVPDRLWDRVMGRAAGV